MSLNIDQFKNVLVLVPDKHLGDLVLSLSAVTALKKYFKEKIFYLVVDSAYIEIVESMDGLENMVLYPRKLLKENPFIKRMIILFNFLKQLRSSSPDIAIDLQGGVASSTITFLSGAPLRVGRSTAKRPYFYNKKIDILHGKHKLYNYMDIVSAIGAQCKAEVYPIRASDRKRSALESILMKYGISIEKPIISIHAGAGVIYKQWTEEGFADVSNWLVSEGFQVIFVGSKDDVENINKIRFPLKHRSFSLAGKLSLGELTALFENSLLFIGNDSGPMHLANATGIPIVALFGPAREARWGPISKNSIVLRGNEPCQKCKGKDCDYDFQCIRTISSDDVKRAIKKLINSNEVIHGEETRVYR